MNATAGPKVGSEVYGGPVVMVSRTNRVRLLVSYVAVVEYEPGWMPSGILLSPGEAETMTTYTHDYCRKIKARPAGCHRLAGHSGECTGAGLGVGHVWTAVQCPAYRTFVPADCTCNNGRES